MQAVRPLPAAGKKTKLNKTDKVIEIKVFLQVMVEM